MFAYLWQQNITLFVTSNVALETWQLQDIDDHLFFLPSILLPLNLIYLIDSNENHFSC